VGGRGNDTLDGGDGDDVYVIARGDGRDRLLDTGGVDRIRWGEGVKPADLAFTHAGPDLIVGHGAGDELRLVDWHRGRETRIELLEFADGTGAELASLANRRPVAAPRGSALAVDSGVPFAVELPAVWFRDPDALDTLAWRVEAGAGESALPGWLHFDAGTRRLSGTAPASVADSLPLRASVIDSAGASATLAFSLALGAGMAQAGTVDGDFLRGTDWADRLDAAAGDDRIDGLDGHDSLYGDAGADVIAGGGGDDVLVGGSGDDALSGGAGNDSYRFAGCSGNDRIVNLDSAGFDEILFEDATAAADLLLSRESTHLVISRSGGEDRITIVDWYGAREDRVDRIRIAAGEALYAADVDRLVEAMTHFAPRPAPGEAFAPRLAGHLAIELAAAWQPVQPETRLS